MTITKSQSSLVVEFLDIPTLSVEWKKCVEQEEFGLQVCFPSMVLSFHNSRQLCWEIFLED